MGNESSSNSNYTDQRNFKQFDLWMGMHHYARVHLDWSQWKAGRGQVEVGWSRHRIKYWALPDSAKFYYRPQLHCDAADIFNKEHHYFATVAPSPQRMPFREKYKRASSLLKSKGSLVVWNWYLVTLLPWWKKVIIVVGYGHCYKSGGDSNLGGNVPNFRSTSLSLIAPDWLTDIFVAVLKLSLFSRWEKNIASLQ